MLNFPEKTLKPTPLNVSRNIWLKAEIKTTVVLFMAFPIKPMAGRLVAHLVTHQRGSG